MNAEILWSPSAERVANARISQFTQLLREKYAQSFPNYHALWRWSLANKEVFWRELWQYTECVGELGERVAIDGHKMPGVQWFPDGRLNFAENLLRGFPGCDDEDALVFANESGGSQRTSWRELRAQVAACASALQLAGVREGDVVASLLPNIPEAAVAMLASTSLGATWSSASPDFGAQGVLDRFVQIAPKVLFAVDGYFYNGKWNDTTERVAEIVSKLPSLQWCVNVENRDAVGAAPPRSNSPITSVDRGIAAPTSRKWNDFLANAPARALTFNRVAFNHPLFIVYSSGTTGLPKAIIHGTGGTLLQLVKEHALHGDLKPRDRVFYFSTTGWIMWNWLIAGLSQGATCLLYDGSPFADRGRVLWDFAERERCTHFGTSAKYIDAIKKLGVAPRSTNDLSQLRTVYSTGSPLSPESFDYVYQCVKPDVHLASISGGTDIMSCFAIGNPTLPVRRGEMQCRALGMAVEVWDEHGSVMPPGSEEMGELVCSQAFPSMPLGFVNDPDQARYKAAYYERFPGVWTHGDWCQITATGGVVIVGRSDATLNPGGVRIGTAEIYRQVETIDEVVESIAIGQIFNHDTRVVLFVKLREGLTLGSALVEQIKQRIRENTTPRHVPAKIVQVDDIPRTKSNKIVELAVRDVVHGRNPKNIEALANPEALEHFRSRLELLS
jgi:acetoacetyl-CoA synthetase